MTHCRSRPVFSAIGVLLYALVSTASVQAEEIAEFYKNPQSIYGEQAVYRVSRNGDPIGLHTVSFRHKDEHLQVNIESDMTVTYLGVPVYRFKYSAEEIWRDQVFESVSVEIIENRKLPRVMQAGVDGHMMTITSGDKSRLAPQVYFASNHWHPGVLEARRLFHTTHGKVYNVKLEDLGLERVELETTDNEGARVLSTIQARHYRYKAGFKADVWYDERNRWIRLQFPADDGSLIDYRCESCITIEAK